MGLTIETCSSTSAHWLRSLRYDDLPAKVIEDAKLRILDTLGVTLAACFTPVGDVRSDLFVQHLERALIEAVGRYRGDV